MFLVLKHKADCLRAPNNTFASLLDLETNKKRDNIFAHTIHAARIARAGNTDVQYQGERSHIWYHSEIRMIIFTVRSHQNIANDPWIQKVPFKLSSWEIHMGE